jgi:hypothetical protein
MTGDRNGAAHRTDGLRPAEVPADFKELVAERFNAEIAADWPI